MKMMQSLSLTNQWVALPIQVQAGLAQLSLAHLLRPATQLQQVAQPNAPELSIASMLALAA